ncbi:hypothetical protein L195_g007393 [Trifolium pratense]|uniref:Uncharacterized protein n=1 Tax=Trifolium pratense TaxID=57577 RepID=A0A2K3P683_TRIPR|nr:hypothetical protein L195_g007393 [Trifolium pratense]
MRNSRTVVYKQQQQQTEQWQKPRQGWYKCNVDSGYHDEGQEAMKEAESNNTNHGRIKTSSPTHNLSKQSNGLHRHSYRRHGPLATLPMNHFHYSNMI